KAIDRIGVLFAVYFLNAVAHRSFSNLKVRRTADVARASLVVWISRPPLALMRVTRSCRLPSGSRFAWLLGSLFLPATILPAYSAPFPSEMKCQFPFARASSE